MIVDNRSRCSSSSPSSRLARLVSFTLSISFASLLLAAALLPGNLTPHNPASSSVSIFPFVAAARTLPAVMSLDPSDVAPLSDEELDSRVSAFMNWLDDNTVSPALDAAVAGKKSTDKKLTKEQRQKLEKEMELERKKKKKQAAKLSVLWQEEEDEGDDEHDADDDDEDVDGAKDGEAGSSSSSGGNQKKKKKNKKKARKTVEIFPFEVRRGSRVSSAHLPAAEFVTDSTRKSQQLQQTLRVFARKNFEPGQTLFRLPSKMILSVDTLCPSFVVSAPQPPPSSSSSNAGGNKPPPHLQDHVPEFCALVRFLKHEATREGTRCSMDQVYFAQSFNTAMIALFLVYMRWGAGANAAGTATVTSPGSGFYKPYIDLMPRVPPTPACTFTDADLELFPLADLVHSERTLTEAAWHFFFDHISTDKFSAVFPQDTLTLPRFMWAMCTVKSRMSVCFKTQVPCLIPGVDMAGHASHLGSEYKTRALPANISSKHDQRTVPTHLLESSNIADQFLFELKLKSPVTAGREFLFDKDHKESSFLHRGALDGGGEGAEKFRCNAVALPRNVAALDVPDEGEAQTQKDAAEQAGARQHAAEQAEEEAEIEKQQQQQQQQKPAEKSDNRQTNDNSNRIATLFSKSTNIAKTDDEMDRERRDRITREFEKLYSECSEQLLGVPASLAPRDLGPEVRREHHFPYMCLREHELFHTASVVESLHLYDTSCTQETFRKFQKVPATTVSKLHSVAYLGKLVRNQLERLSEALTKIENVVSAVRADGRSKVIGGGDPRAASAGFGFTDPSVKSSSSSSSSSDDSGKNPSAQKRKEQWKKIQQQELPAYVTAAKAQTSICASWGFLPNGGATMDSGSTASSGALSTAQQLQQRKSGVYSTADSDDGRPCRVFFGSDAKHALLIHDWTKLEHASLTRIYDQLVKLRGQLRAQLRVEDL